MANLPACLPTYLPTYQSHSLLFNILYNDALVSSLRVLTHHTQYYYQTVEGCVCPSNDDDDDQPTGYLNTN